MVAAQQALTQQGLAAEAVGELEHAVAVADKLGSPLVRWETRAALASAQRASGTDPQLRLTESARIIQEVAASLSPERAAVYLGAPATRAVLEAQ